MDYQTFMDWARKAVAAHIQERDGGEVDPNRLQILWTGTAMEIRKIVFWYGKGVYVLEYNEMTEETKIDTYIKTEE